MNQADYWNGEAGAIWASLAPVLDAALGPLGEAAMAALGPTAGERLLDVGCGAGATSRALYQRVSPGGSVLGVDLSGPLLEAARAAAGGPSFLHADASAAELPGAPFDRIFSRFGVMFFEEPVRAFGHLRAALRPGGRIGFVCWRALAENDWATRPVAAVQDLLRDPPVASPPDAPGPFALADEGRLRGILDGAGFADVEVRPLDAHYRIGRSLDEAVEVSMRIGPLGRLVREQQLDLATIRGALRDALVPHVHTDESVSFPAACWIVTATNAPT